MTEAFFISFKNKFSETLDSWDYYWSSSIRYFLHEEIASMIISTCVALGYNIYAEIPLMVHSDTPKFFNKRDIIKDRGRNDLLVKLDEKNFVIIEIETYKEGQKALDVFTKRWNVRKISPNQAHALFILIYCSEDISNDKIFQDMLKKMNKLSKIEKSKKTRIVLNPISWMLLGLEIQDDDIRIVHETHDIINSIRTHSQ